MEVVIPYSPREQQQELHDSPHRWNLIICHRRFGKTVYEINKLIKAALTCDKPNPRFAYIAPFLKQAKAIAWDYLKFYSRPIPGIEINEGELRIDYPNGSRVRLFGADNPDALRGVYLDGVALDEYAQINPSLFAEVLRPALSDRRGWADFMGTPKGRNHFWELYEQVKGSPDWGVYIYRASETGILPDEELDSAKQIMSVDQYEQEYECSFSAAIQGSYYGEAMRRAREQGRVTSIPVATNVAVDTFWDLGRNDSTAIWFMQHVGAEYRLIDYYECSGEGLDHYARVLREKGYLYGDHYLPHDVGVVELTTNKSRRETLESLGVSPIIVVPRVRAINEGIEMARQKIAECFFDEARCDYGLRCLENYRKDWDEKNQVFRSSPLHDWSSHGADAFRMFAQGYRGMSKPQEFLSERRKQRIRQTYDVNWVV